MPSLTESMVVCDSSTHHSSIYSLTKIVRVVCLLGADVVELKLEMESLADYMSLNEWMIVFVEVED